jgi:hypothetical protein
MRIITAVSVGTVCFAIGAAAADVPLCKDGSMIGVTKVHISIYSIDRYDKRADDIRQKLEASKCSATTLPTKRQVPSDEIRYFHDTDKPAAVDIAAFVRERLKINLQFPKAATVFQAQKGEIEIWLKP